MPRRPVRILWRQDTALLRRASDVGNRTAADIGPNIVGFGKWRRAGNALPDHHVKATIRIGRHLIGADVDDAHARLKPGGIEHRRHRVGTAGKDIDASDRFPRMTGWNDLNPKFFTHFIGKPAPIFFGRAVDSHQANRPHGTKGLQIASRHAPGAEHADDRCVLSREVSGTNPGAAANAQMLNCPIIENGQRLTVARAEQKDQAAVKARCHAVPFLGTSRSGLRPARQCPI